MLTFDAINLIGKTLKILIEKNLIIEPQSILCDAGDIWNEGNFFIESLKKVYFFYFKKLLFFFVFKVK